MRVNSTTHQAFPLGAGLLAATLVLAGTMLGGDSRPNRAEAATTTINPSKDNTLYEYFVADGDRSNGAGDRFFAGKTDQGRIRRGVLAFDVAGSIPAGSTITSVTLTMNMSRTKTSTVRTVELHKLLADWGEGTSNAGQNEGVGTAATTNDATWRHRFFSAVLWALQGGDFSGTVSANQSVGATGTYSWSSAQMAADVQAWLNNPAASFGWVVLGDESTDTTAKRFDSRESSNPPVLTIQYTPPATPTPAPTPTPSTPTPTPTGPASTPTPTSTATPSSTPTATATSGVSPSPCQVIWDCVHLTQGDVDCAGAVDSVDALKELRYVTSLPVLQDEPCPGIGTNEAVVLWGDTDCSGGVTSVDALKILRYVASLPVQQTEPCADIGTLEN